MTRDIIKEAIADLKSIIGKDRNGKDKEIKKEDIEVVIASLEFALRN